MNKIFKVVWSKVKHCYVVVSEVAKNVITGSIKSAKIGSTPMTRGLALGAMMAFVITGNAWAETTTEYNDYFLPAGDFDSLKVAGDSSGLIDGKHMISELRKRGVLQSHINIIQHTGIHLEEWLSGFENDSESVLDTVNCLKTHPLMPRDVTINGFMMDSTTGRLFPIKE